MSLTTHKIIKYRYYGNNIKYIDVADKWDDGDMKNALVKVIANHMKSGARKRTKTPTTS
jgi:hypothetical protein